MTIPENLPSTIWATAWCELYKLYGERLDQENLDIMDSVLHGVEAEFQDEIAREKSNDKS